MASELLSAAEKMADYGVETVTFTFVVFTYLNEFPKIENQILREKAVKALRGENLYPTCCNEAVHVSRDPYHGYSADPPHPRDPRETRHQTVVSRGRSLTRRF
ncbi:MAG: hypothetical protein FJY85_25600 [Deltaproteobacteria bacterium]|nr:hypothetical protein [Deltaproteobacteria bacterium]